MNTEFRKKLPGTTLDYYDVREAVDAIEPGAYAKLPYTSRVLAENLVRRCEPSELTDSLKQLIYRKSDLDFPWYPARVVCHDILGQTALVDLAGLRDAIAGRKIWLRWLIWFCLLFYVILLGEYGPGYSAAEFIYQGF